jgi:hypothetical protein
LVCGHIHHADMREVHGVLCCHDGDLAESFTALAEHLDGRLKTVDMSAADRAGMQLAPQPSAAPAPLPAPVAVA